MTRSEQATVEKEVKPLLSGQSPSRAFPNWFRNRQRAAWKQFESLPYPTRKDQVWRFAKVDLLDLKPFKHSGALTEKARAIILSDRTGWMKSPAA